MFFGSLSLNNILALSDLSLSRSYEQLGAFLTIGLNYNFGDRATRYI